MRAESRRSRLTTVAIDHVILVVADLAAAADLLRRDHGLASLPGGRHTGHGTANRITPLGDSYLELMGVVDAVEAETSPMGRWALAHRQQGLIPAGLCLRTDDASAEAARLGVTAAAMSRARPDGVVLSWRNVGADDMFAGRAPLFFIHWDDMAMHPGRAPVDHHRSVGGIERVVVSGDPAALSARIGDQDLPVVLETGPPGIRRVLIGTGAESILLGE